MSDSDNQNNGGGQVIIVKRNKGAHDGHHGGAWKIAYADFMTAMMAFFLVMWLVNAANEETKASVASFFNPIQLADEKPTKRGLEKPVETDDGIEKNERSDVQDQKVTIGSAAATGEDMTSQSGQETNFSEADFFENPYSVLAEIAQEVGQQANVSAKGEGGASDSGPATGAEGGEAYRDPFDPDFWTQQVKVTRTDRQPEADQPPSSTAQSDVENPLDDPASQIAAAQVTQQDPLAQPDDAPAEPPKPDVIADAATQASDADQTEPAVPNDAQVAKAIPQDKPDNFDEIHSAEEIEVQRQAQELEQEIAEAMRGVPGKLAEGLIVTPAEGGFLVTVSDQSETPMFNVGSAVPKGEMVLAMEKIGAILKARGGSVVIRGHTDGRQFKGGKNDNWRLSMERAHSAYYMLVRGGLSEERIKQVSGFADRRLQVPNDPLANENRRIEILLEADQG